MRFEAGLKEDEMEWISVKEKTPEYGEFVLGWDDYEFHAIRVVFGVNYNDVFQDMTGRELDITHWLKPTPPNSTASDDKE